MNILTFDLEEWFHLLDNPSTDNEKNWDSFEFRLQENTDRVLNLLSETNNIATFFCLGWVARKYPDIVKKIASLGHEIGSHSNSHQLLHRHNRDFFKNDLEASLKSLEDLIGKKITSYRAPGFSLVESTIWAFDELVEHGIEFDCSVFLGNHSHGGRIKSFRANPSIINIKGKKIKEFPVNSFKFINKEIPYTGGGYFRLLPYGIIKYLIKNSDYNMTYFHPRDFDKNQPIIKDLSYFRLFKSYYGLSHSLKKAKKIFNDFDFVNIHQANNLYDWNKAQQLKLENGILIEP
jgi:peptidoglycan-N-acetylglucosamine deacetylase